MKLQHFGLLALLGCTGLGGCIPIVAGALIYDNAENREAKAKFSSDLNTQNIDREKAGLKPLDWCSEAYKAKRSWAEEDKPCAARIKAYDAGDHSQLTL